MKKHSFVACRGAGEARDKMCQKQVCVEQELFFMPKCSVSLWLEFRKMRRHFFDDCPWAEEAAKKLLRAHHLYDSFLSNSGLFCTKCPNNVTHEASEDLNLTRSFWASSSKVLLLKLLKKIFSKKRVWMLPFSGQTCDSSLCDPALIRSVYCSGSTVMIWPEWGLFVM